MKLSLLLVASTVYAQSQPDVIRSTTRLVQMSVVAVDKSGHPVLDLKKEDFRLLDENKQRDLRVFNLNSVQPKPRRGASGIYSNAELSGPSAITIIVIDSMNTKWTDQSRATRQLIQFLRQIQPEDHVAIYSINGRGGFQVLHGFTRDASDLVKTLAKWKGQIPRADPKDQDVGSALAQVLQGTDPVHREDQLAGDFDFHNAPATLAAMEAIANSLKNIPGRKNLIWISDGFEVVEWGNLAATAKPGCAKCAPYLVNSPIWSVYGEGHTGQIHDSIGEGDNFSPQMDRAMHIVDQANLTIYPIDASGLETGGSKGTQDVMLDIAKKTGGRAFINGNDIAGAIRAASEDARVTYTLGFYPETVNLDGKFHRVKISLLNRPGVTLRYRAGYVDETGSPSVPQTRKAELDEAFRSPIDVNAILLKAEVRENILDVRIDPASLQFSFQNGRHAGEFDILILQRNETGENFGRINDTVVMNFREATFTKFLREGIPYQRLISFDPKATAIRIVVRDAATGNIGSLTIPVS
jgi:VWFA-related protein